MESNSEIVALINNNEILSVMDLLDLEEELINTRLKFIMKRESLSNQHLISAIQLLQYKQLINLKENIECENDEEFDFIANILKELNIHNIQHVCKIIGIVLQLNSDELISKSEHLLQQILFNIEVQVGHQVENEIATATNNLLYLKICDSILDVIIRNKRKVTILFLDTPLENLLQSSDEKFKIHFLINTVPKIFEAVVGYNILDRIWNYLITLAHNRKDCALKIISCLADFYLPVQDGQGILNYESNIVYHFEFWNLITYGLMSTDHTMKKISICLAKRTIDCLLTLRKPIQVMKGNNIIFLWDPQASESLKIKWDNFFILIECLEEKQSNIVIPSLRLIELILDMDSHWLSCIFQMGLKHDSCQVRKKCIEYRIKKEIDNDAEALTLLEALNDVYTFSIDRENFKEIISNLILTNVNVIKVIPMIKWSPVIYYQLSTILSSLDISNAKLDKSTVLQVIIDLLNVPCNNEVIRKAINVNLAQFSINCFHLLVELGWKNYIKLFSIFSYETLKVHHEILNKQVQQHFILNEKSKTDFLNMVLQSCLYIDIGLLYLKVHIQDVGLYKNIIFQKINKICDLINRQYANKFEYFDEVIYMIDLFKKTTMTYNLKEISDLIVKEYKLLVQYFICLLSNEGNKLLEIDATSFIMGLSYLFEHNVDNPEVREHVLHLYKSSILLLKGKDTDFNKKVLSLFILKSLRKSFILNKYYKHEILEIKQTLYAIAQVDFQKLQNKESARLKNRYMEISCHIICGSLENYQHDIKRHLDEVITFIDVVLETGGYGCLKWILKIMYIILPTLLDDQAIKFDLCRFIDRVWKEIEELKSNKQYRTCIKQFILIITHGKLLKYPTYNNMILLYCNKIVEYGSVKIYPLHCLIKQINNKVLMTEFQLVYVLCEILLFSPAVRRDQRNEEIVEIEILNNTKFGIDRENTEVYLNFDITCFSVETLSQIENCQTLSIIKKVMCKKIDDVFKNKVRYHENTQAHKLILLTLQHHLFISMIEPNIDNTKSFNWAIELLGKLPHQPNVKICFEWYIALNIYRNEKNIDTNTIEMLKVKKIPLLTQLVILFWIIKHKLMKRTNMDEEYHLVMDMLLSNTMGAIFNLRLHAQYFAIQLHRINGKPNDKYSYIINVIEKSFLEHSDDKNVIKIKDDYFMNHFDIIADFTPLFIYYCIPKYQNNITEALDVPHIKDFFKKLNENVIKKSNNDDFKKEWISSRIPDENIFNLNWCKNTIDRKDADNNEIVEAIIQKKYIPWRNMTDIEMYELSKKIEISNDLIVVASLIDKLPNLGGLARTSEVFGVNTYVVDSLRHLQDKQFQGLSVSAERWLNIEEVRPGTPLKKYIMAKRSEGYSIVAAEQTSTSCTLQSFKFPKKTVLILGHEKEGIPCDFLPLMDYCVEIPQQGFVRSLNVHVTAAIFIWEYVRQNILA